MCCFLDLSHTLFRGLRGMKIETKGKTGQQCMKMQNVKTNCIFKKKKSDFPQFIFNDECTGGSSKQHITRVWPNDVVVVK